MVEEFNQREEFLNIARMVYLFTMKMKEHHLIDEMVIDNQPTLVNPFYGRVEAGSAYVVEYSRGVPSLIYSTLGAVEIPAAKLCRGYLPDYKAYQNDIRKMMGWFELQPIIENRMDMIGPRFVVGKMPWLNQQKIPLEYKPQGFNQLAGNQEEIDLCAEIFRKNNEFFQKIGHPEFVKTEKAEIKAPVVEKVAEPKKHTCVILGQVKQMLKNPFRSRGTEKGN